MRVKFWGARGSIPTPMSEHELQDKIKSALINAVGIDLTDREAIDRYVERLPPCFCSPAGGDTSCIALRIFTKVFILACRSAMPLLPSQPFTAPSSTRQAN